MIETTDYNSMMDRMDGRRASSFFGWLIDQRIKEGKRFERYSVLEMLTRYDEEIVARCKEAVAPR